MDLRIAVGGPNSLESDSFDSKSTSMSDELSSFSKGESELKDDRDILTQEQQVGVPEDTSRTTAEMYAQDSLPASPLRSRSNSFNEDDLKRGSSTAAKLNTDVDRETISFSTFVDANIGEATTHMTTSVFQEEKEDTYASPSFLSGLNVSTMSETLKPPSEVDALDSKEVIAALSGNGDSAIPKIHVENVELNDTQNKGEDTTTTAAAKSPLKEVTSKMSTLRIDVPPYEPKSYHGMLPTVGVEANYANMQHLSMPSGLLPEEGHGLGREQYGGDDLDTPDHFRRSVDNPYDSHHSLDHNASMNHAAGDGMPGNTPGLTGHGNYAPSWSPNVPSTPQRFDMYYNPYGFDSQSYSQPRVENNISPYMPPPGMDSRPLTSRAMPDSLNHQSPHSSQTHVSMDRAPPGMLSPTTPMQGSPYLSTQQDLRVNQYYTSPSSQALPPSTQTNSQQSHSTTLASPQSSIYYQQQSPSKRLSPNSGASTGGASSTGASSKDRADSDMPRESADDKVYQVRFKRASRNFSLHQLAPRDINVGDFVRVEADRGEDLGVVQTITPLEHFIEETLTAGYRGRGFSSGVGERKWLYRLATTTERLQIRDKVEDEQVALQVINRKISERGLPMRILDAEYQFDRHKLVFFFEANHRIDFRELVSELFSLYKTRIWMQQVETSFLEDDDPGVELAKQTGLLLPFATAETSFIPLSDEYDSRGQSGAPLVAMTSTSGAPLLASMNTVRDSEAMAMNQNLGHHASYPSSRQTSRTASPSIGSDSMMSPSFKEHGGNGSSTDSNSSTSSGSDSGNGSGSKGKGHDGISGVDTLFLSNILEDEKEVSSDDDNKPNISRSYRHSPGQVHKQSSPVHFRHL